MSVYIETDRLILRSFSIEDIPALIKNSQEESVKDYMPHLVCKNTIEATRWICNINKLQMDDESTNISLAIILKDSLKCIGYISLDSNFMLDNLSEISFYISEQYWNKGLVTEATTHFCNWCFDNLPIKRIAAIVRPDNKASAKVIQKIGFIKKGKRELFYGKYITFDYYQLLNKKKT